MFVHKIKNGNRNATHLKAEIYYALGGTNVFTYKNEPRGYYLSVSPVERAERNGYTMESFAAFSGKKWIVLPVQRKVQRKWLKLLSILKTISTDIFRHFQSLK